MKKNFIRILILLIILCIGYFILIPYIKDRNLIINLNNVKTIGSYAINYVHKDSSKLSFEIEDLEKIGFKNNKPDTMYLKVKQVNQYDSLVEYAITYDNYCFYKTYDSKASYEEMKDNRNCTKYGLDTNSSCFDIENDTIVKYKCNNNVIIPNKINGIDIKKIESNAFANLNINKVIISDNIEYINSYAFLNSNIKELVLGNNLYSIESNAFRNNKITSIVLPDSLKILKESAFENNNINNIIFGNGLIEISKRVFANNNLEYVNFSNSNIKKLDDEVFINNKLTGINLGNIETINNNVFKNNSFMNLTIPSSIKYIGTNAFYIDYNSNFELQTIYVNNQRLKDLKWSDILGNSANTNIVNLGLLEN